MKINLKVTKLFNPAEFCAVFYYHREVASTLVESDPF